MVEHLEYFNQVALNRMEADWATPPEKVDKYTASLYNYRLIPRNFHNVLFREGALEDLRYGSLAEAKEGLINSLKEVEEKFKLDPDWKAYSPTFGYLNRYEWKLYCQKHFQHHFVQFGLM